MREVTAFQMREIDRRAREEFGIPERILMEHAGTAVAREVKKMAGLESRRRGQVIILSGGGSNGGDGFVAARHLHNWGYPVEVVLLADRKRVRGASSDNLEILQRLGVVIHQAGTLRGWSAWAKRSPRVSVFVDSLLGTGASGPVREPIRSAILWINRRQAPVVSVDLPSGFSADDGKPEDVAVRADRTVTCGLLKVGFRKPEAHRWCGKVQVADISLPIALR